MASESENPFQTLASDEVASVVEEVADVTSVVEVADVASVVEVADVTKDDAVEFGFKRPEMYKTNLAGTVDPPYGRHVFLCYKSHEDWPARIEDSEADPLPKLLADAFKARRKDFTVRTRLTICEGGEDLKLADGDVLIFPDMIKYKGLKESDVDGFVEDVLVSGKTWGSGEQEDINGSYVFICAHNNRDRRCGVCGPLLMEKFNSEIESKDLKNQVSVIACSHIGGHKYAGNLIIYSADSQGKIAGHWYGYVTPDDVLELLDEHIGKGEIIERLWRGKMGIPPPPPPAVEETVKVDDEPKQLTNGTTTTTVIEREEKAAEESDLGCCQGVTEANGFQCCRATNTNEISEKKSTKGGGGGLCDWTSKWERQIFTTSLILGAVATCAVGYAVYKKSR